MGAYFGKQGGGGEGGWGGYLTSGCRDGPKKRKKAPAASWLAATGLVRSAGGHFHRKKSACGKLVSSNRACQIHGWSFSPKKAPAASWLAATGLVKSAGGHFHKKEKKRKRACGKLDSSNRACQVRSVPCQVGSVSCRVKSGPCQPPSVSCRVKPHPCQSVPCRVLSDPCVSACPCHVGATLHWLSLQYCFHQGGRHQGVRHGHLAMHPNVLHKITAALCQLEERKWLLI